MQREAGSRLGHYEILDLAGKGGMLSLIHI